MRKRRVPSVSVRISLLDLPPSGQMLLDTVHLWAPRRRYRWKPGTGYWWKPPAKPTNAYKAFYNDRSTGWSIIIDEYDSLKIEGSVPRAVKGNNFDSITEDEFPQLENYIRTLCKGRCVKVNLAALTVSRVDLARNKELDFLVPGFIKETGKVTEYGTMKRSKSKSQDFFGSTYVRWENKQRETVLYDKIASMLEQVKKHKIKADSIPERADEVDWLRSEVRLMQSTSCKREGIRKFKDLKDNEKHWALWQEENRRIIGRARELGHYTDRVAQPSKEFFKLVKKYATEKWKPGEEKEKPTPKLLKLIAAVTGGSRFLDEFGGRRGFYEWLDTLNVKTMSKDTWRKRKDRLRETIDEITKYRTLYVTKAKPSLIWEIYETWVNTTRLPLSTNKRFTTALRAMGWSNQDIQGILAG